MTKEPEPYEELLRSIRSFRNAADQQGPYDLVGTVHLLLAALDNLRGHTTSAELEDIAGCFLPEQRRFLLKLCQYLEQGARES